MTIHSVAFLLLVLSPLLVSCQMDDIVYWPDNGHYYQWMTVASPISYSAAQTLASSKAHNKKTGYVVTIGSATEQAFLNQYLYNKLTTVSAGASDWPTIWSGATRSGKTYSWQAAGRTSNPFFDCTTLVCAAGAYCNWNITTTANFVSTLLCSQIFLNNVNGPTPGSWRPTSCSSVSQAIVVEYDNSQTCDAGFTYSTSKGWCEDLNECANNPKICGVGYQCNNTIGSYYCSDVDECQNKTICRSGFQCHNLNGSYECVDIDECAMTPSVCMSGYTCTNLRGSYQCNDINECTANSTLCTKGYVCVNTPGSYSCDDINECNQTTGSAPCTFGTKCVNTVGSYTCDSLYYRIQSAWNNLVLDAILVNGVYRIITSAITNSTSQLWSFDTQGYVVNGFNGQVIDAEGGNVYPGVFAILWPRKPVDQADNQFWRYDSATTYWYTANYDDVLDIYHGDSRPGAYICLFTPKASTDPTGNLNQKWNLLETDESP